MIWGKSLKNTVPCCARDAKIHVMCEHPCRNPVYLSLAV